MSAAAVPACVSQHAARTCVIACCARLGSVVRLLTCPDMCQLAHVRTPAGPLHDPVPALSFEPRTPPVLYASVSYSHTWE